MTSLALDGIPLPLSSLELVERLPYVSISRNGKGRKYWVGQRKEALGVEIGPVPKELGQWLLARLTKSDGWALTQDEWSTSGLPLGVSIVAQVNPLGTHCAHLSASVPLPFPSEHISATYWHSPDGSAWTFYRQSNASVATGTAKLTYASGTWHLATGYWVGLTVTPATLPLAHLTQLSEGFSGRPYISGAAVEVPGPYSAQIDSVDFDLSEQMTIRATLT